MAKHASFSEFFLFNINKLFPPRKVFGRNSHDEYVAAQRNWAIQSSSYYDPFLDLKDKVVLDAGCGAGGKTMYYHEKGTKYIVGIDLNEGSIANAKKLKGQLENIDFQLIGLEKLPFENDFFDYIIMDDVIEHLLVDNIPTVLKECKRVLKPNGRLIAQFPPWTSNDAAHLYDYIRMPWCHVFFSDKTLINVSKLIAKDNLQYFGFLERQYYELNRITIQSSKKLFLAAGFAIHHFEQITVLGQKWFRIIPFLNRYLTKRVFVVLTK